MRRRGGRPSREQKSWGLWLADAPRIPLGFITWRGAQRHHEAGHSVKFALTCYFRSPEYKRFRRQDIEQRRSAKAPEA